MPRVAIMLELGVIADDLTGSVKLASLLTRAGVRCPVVTSADALGTLDDDAAAVVVGRKLLARPAREAVHDAARIGQALLARGARQLYYKYSALFSSTERGNIGPVAEALMNLTGSGYVLFCPARPERRATVYQGRLFLGSAMLHETPRRHDPVTPMTNSNLVEVLQSQSQVPVGLLSHGTLRSGKAASERYLGEQRAAGVRFFLVDATDGSDLDRIAELVRDAALVTGSDDLPVALARRWPASGRSAVPTLPSAAGHAVLIAGSCTPKSGRQLARFERAHPVLRIDLLQAARDAATVERAVDWAAERLAHGPLGVATTTDADGVRRAQAELGREGAAALAEGLLARLAQRLYGLGARNFVVAGGETSGAVLEALGVDRLQVAPYDELEGGYCHRAGEDPLSLVLKAGASGDENFFDAAVARMRAAASPRR